MVKIRPLNLSPITRISIGLVFLTVSALMTANWIGLTPDNTKAILDARKKVAETLAVQVSKLAEQGDVGIVKTVLEVVHERNKDIVALSFSKADGKTLVEAGDKSLLKKPILEDISTPTRFLVPIFNGDKKWGRIAIHYKPLGSDNLFGFLSPLMLLILFIALSGYILYHLFLKRALSYLDPAAVIPDRVKTAMDVLAEGVLILDEKERIVLANKSFTEKTRTTDTELLGKRLTDLPWKLVNKEEKSKFPWTLAIENGHPQMAFEINISSDNDKVRTFMVNAAPILDVKNNSQGVLTTFDDVTKLEKRNTQLNSMLERLERAQKEVQSKNKELVILASQDSLTGCLNRRAFFEKMDAEFAKIQNGNYSITCIMLDIDFFKSVNDNYGHGVGDQVIRSLANILKSSLREGDQVCRYGGEEFCLLLKNTTSLLAKKHAERMRQEVERLEFKETPSTRDLKITSSFGISDSTFNASNPTELINQADYALYNAKESGRNRVELWQPSTEKDIATLQADAAADDQAPPLITEVTSVTHYELSSQDELTGLPSRSAFVSMIQDAMQLATGHDKHIAVLYIDIDDFKRVNNLLGFDVGNYLLKEQSNRLSEILRSSDGVSRLNTEDEEPAVSRLSGDQFGILLRSVPSTGQTKSIVSRILQALAEPYKISENVIYATCSIGISLYPQDGLSADLLLRNAEIAMNSTKSMNGNNYSFYTPTMDIESIGQLKLENDLRHALLNKEMDIYYQPKVDLATDKVVGVEALVRWKHPIKGLILPNTFLSIAEKTGLIHDLGAWVFRSACEQAKSWKDSGLSDFTVAVNVSATQFTRDGFVEQIFAILSSTQVDSRLIEIEVTEHTMVHNIDHVTSIISKLRSFGVSVSLDDFGTGYSSLHHIKQFPIDSIKIDISFIQNITSNKNDIVIVSAIISMAHAMGIKIIAEGVENAEQLQILRELQCDQVQGFIFGRPKASKDATELFRTKFSSANDVSRSAKKTG